MPFALDPPPNIITFDCYGTLVQWDEVLQAAIGDVLATTGRSDLAPQAVLDHFATIARGLEQSKPHRLYKTVLRDGFAATFADLGVPARPEDVARVAQSITRMGPHPETQAVLRQLRTRYKLAIFTNSDEDLIAHNVRLLGVPIDFVITAESAQAYKPSRTIFESGHRRLGVTRDEVVHVAMSMDLDIQACHALGIRGIWINRRGLAGNPDWRPYEELPDLRGVPALLGC
jgi:2-haloalkanoic acid dehalogenase type II